MLSEKTLLILCCLFFILVYILAYPQHAFYSDEGSYLKLGSEILNGGYSKGIIDRAPVLPLLVSASYVAGLGFAQIMFLLPLIFGLLFILVTYLIGKRFCKNPLIPVVIVLSFPFFWKWVPFLLVDVLLGIFAGLALLYLYKGVEDDKKHLNYAFIFLALSALVKVSAVLLLLVFILYPLIRRKPVFKTREFLGGLLIFLAVFLAASSITFLASGSTGANLRFMTLDYFRDPSYYLLNFALVPWSLAFLYGLYRLFRDRKREAGFALLSFLVVFAFFSMLVWKEMRFLIFIIPMFAVLIENGLQPLKKHWKYLVIALFFVLGFAESMLLLNTVTYVTWGTDLMTNELTQLEADAVIAADSEVIFYKQLSSRVLPLPNNATQAWIQDNSIDYIVLSIYGEIGRNPDLSYYMPRMGPIDAPFLGGGEPKMILTWWPDYEFNSVLYQEIDSAYESIKTINYGDQDVFIIYKT